MTSALHRLVIRLMGATAALLLGLCLMLIPFGEGVDAARSSMSGDYLKDTVSVIQRLQTTIDMPQEAEGHAAAEKEAITLITDYMAIYRNRQGISSLQSFTTMQTALNSLAGHYKNYANRPLSDQLKDRIGKQFTKAEKGVERGN